MLVQGAMVGHHKVGEMIGQGGMCSVYRGTHTLLDRHVAIKVLLKEHLENSEIVDRFFNEARALTKLADPGIVQVFDFGHHDDGHPYIVMEFLEGESMARRLSRVRRFGAVECVRLARLMCTSLEVVHSKGIIHRDLKPENIFLVPDRSVPGCERAKILDFGIAKLSFDKRVQSRTRTDALIGTPTYMSPEQCSGAGGVDLRSDIYSIGCVIFTMLTGQPPFKGAGLGDVLAAHLREPPPLASSLAPAIHRVVDVVLDTCLKKEPARRFQSMAELSKVLGSVEDALTRSGPEAAVLVDEIIGSCRSERTVNLRAGSPDAAPSSPAGESATLEGSTFSGTTLGGATGQSNTPGAVRKSGRGRRAVGVAIASIILLCALVFVIFPDRDETRAASSQPAVHVPASAPAPPAETETPDAAVVDAMHDAVVRPAEATGAEPATDQGEPSPRRPRSSSAKREALRKAPPREEPRQDRAGEIELDDNGLPIHR